jgi:N-acetylmuramoyl-L-alanine amidase
MAKIVLDAGHGIYCPGKRCLKKIDKNETREWALNDRIVDKVQEKLAEYENVVILRVDDPTGNKDVSLAQRVKAANDFKADLYCSFHHNAGINGGNGGGLSVITYDNRNELVDLRNKLYDCLINAGGIKGNRSNPKYADKNLYVLKNTNMSAVLCEHGFMDSTFDTPIILTNDYAEKMANGWINFLVARFNLKKKAKPAPAPSAPVPSKPTVDTSITAGKPLQLVNTPIYGNATTTSVSSRKTGTYYVWSTDVTNNRIKITNSIQRVGVQGQITGWVNLADVNLAVATTSTSKPANTATSKPTATPTVSQPAVQYYPKYTGTSTSIVSALKSLGIDGGFANRKKIAVANGIVKSSVLYLGTSAQNTTMLKLLKMGKLIKA